MKYMNDIISLDSFYCLAEPRSEYVTASHLPSLQELRPQSGKNKGFVSYSNLDLFNASLPVFLSVHQEYSY